jgi:hypothetical protein
VRAPTGGHVLPVQIEIYEVRCHKQGAEMAYVRVEAATSHGSTAMPRIHLSVPEPSEPSRPEYASSEGLRALLWRLHDAGSGAWRDDSEAEELMQFVTDRYAALARKHHLEPADAAWAAFEAMLNESTRTAADPWAVVTVAVMKTLAAEERANGLLTSTERARRKEVSAFHDAERFSDRENDLAEYYPSLQTSGGFDDELEPTDEGVAHQAMEGLVTLLVVLGWPADLARFGVEYVCSRLIDVGDRHRTYDILRRDQSALVLLDLSHETWIGLLRLILGHPTNPRPLARFGALARLLIGDTLTDLLDDDNLVEAVALTQPAPQGGPS